MNREQGRPEAEEVNETMNAPEDERQTRADAREDAALWPASGAPVHRARVGAELAAEEPALESGETAAAIKRAAENDRRV